VKLRYKPTLSLNARMAVAAGAVLDTVVLQQTTPLLLNLLNSGLLAA